MKRTYHRVSKMLLTLSMVFVLSVQMALAASSSYTAVVPSDFNPTFDSKSYSSPTDIKPYVGFGNYTVRIIKSSALRDLFKGNAEPNSGAHYYAYTPLVNQYEKASAYIDIPSASDLNRGSRHAFICLGYAYPNVCGFDIGLANLGNGWEVFSYSKTGGSLTWNSQLPSNTTRVLLSIGLDRSTSRSIDKVTAIMDCYNSSNQYIATVTGTKTAPKGNLYGDSSFRFFRFVSLVPQYTGYPDTADNTYLTAGFTDLRLHTKTSYTIWSNTLVENAWAMQKENLPILNIGVNGGGYIYDSVKIYHTTNVHYKA